MSVRANSVPRHEHAEYIEDQLNLLCAVREAQDAGVEIPEMWTAYLDMPPEVDAILQILREHGHPPPRPKTCSRTRPDHQVDESGCRQR